MAVNLTFKFHDHCKEKDQVIVDAFSFAASVHKLAEKRLGVHGTGALWFRGQAKLNWPLLPGIGRDHPRWLDFPLRHHTTTPAEAKQEVKRMKGVEYDLLNRFRRHAHAFLHREPAPWETITMAQHYGLPTRLLDWTSSPLTALYFAAEAETKDDGAVFAFRPSKYWDSHINVYRDAHSHHHHERDPLKVNGVRIIYPMMSSDRLVAQNGGFTIQKPWLPLEKLLPGKRFSSKAVEIVELHKWKLPKDQKQNVVSQVLRAGISHKSLFPDLAGTAMGLLRAELLREHGGSRTLPASFT